MKKASLCLIATLVVLIGLIAVVAFSRQDTALAKRIVEETLDLFLPKCAYADSAFGPIVPPPPPPIP